MLRFCLDRARNNIIYYIVQFDILRSVQAGSWEIQKCIQSSILPFRCHFCSYFVSCLISPFLIMSSILPSDIRPSIRYTIFILCSSTVLHNFFECAIIQNGYFWKKWGRTAAWMNYFVHPSISYCIVIFSLILESYGFADSEKLTFLWIINETHDLVTGRRDLESTVFQKDLTDKNGLFSRASAFFIRFSVNA